MKKILLLTLLLVSACAPVSPLPAGEGAGGEVPTATLTPTAVPPTEVPPTNTPRPTETQIPVSETDLKIKDSRTETVSLKYMGVQIDAKLITDESLDPVIRKVTVGEQAYAEFMARSVYGVWENTHKGQSFETYMQMLAEVQQGKRNPLDVAIPIYANDLKDGIPYQNADKSVNPAAQKKYLVIPWYKGEVQSMADGVEVRALSEINIALVNGKKVKNITLFKEDGGLGKAMGISLDGNVLNFYNTILWIDNIPNRPGNTAGAISCFRIWMIKNNGKSIAGSPVFSDVTLMKLLLGGGVIVE